MILIPIVILSFAFSQDLDSQKKGGDIVKPVDNFDEVVSSGCSQNKYGVFRVERYASHRLKVLLNYRLKPSLYVVVLNDSSGAPAKLPVSLLSEVILSDDNKKSIKPIGYEFTLPDSQEFEVQIKLVENDKLVFSALLSGRE